MPFLLNNGKMPSWSVRSLEVPDPPKTTWNILSQTLALEFALRYIQAVLFMTWPHPCQYHKIMRLKSLIMRLSTWVMLSLLRLTGLLQTVPGARLLERLPLSLRTKLAVMPKQIVPFLSYANSRPNPNQLMTDTEKCGKHSPLWAWCRPSWSNS